jgi:hypothetical protein
MKKVRVLLLACLLFFLSVPIHAKDIEVIQKSGKIITGANQVTSASYIPTGPLNPNIEVQILLSNPNNERNPNGQLRAGQNISVDVIVTELTIGGGPAQLPTSMTFSPLSGGVSQTFTFTVQPETSALVYLRSLLQNTTPPMLIPGVRDPAFFSLQINWDAQKNTKLPLITQMNGIYIDVNNSISIIPIPFLTGE